MRCVWVACAWLAAGCVAQQEPYLRWQAGTPSGRMDGKVALKLVPNLRPAGRGEGGLYDIGRERTASGAAVAGRLEGGTKEAPHRAGTRLTIEAMKAAGLAPPQTQEPSAAPPPPDAI